MNFAKRAYLYIKHRPLFYLWLGFLLISMLTFFCWKKEHINSLTGDEPHYLVISKGLLKYHSFELNKPYADEFKSRSIMKAGLSPDRNAIPSPENTHAVEGPHGLFSIHNIGLAVLLALPFKIGGITLAKIFMVCLASLVVYLTWMWSEIAGANESQKKWITFLSCFSLSLIPTANQIYPDLVAGLIFLFGLYWLFTIDKPRTVCQEGVFALILSFAPWLQIKFGLEIAILVVAVAIKIYFESRNIKKIGILFLIATLSCILLLAYNHYAFGKISGPYQEGAIQLSKTSLMVFFGLIADQNQGFLFQNPLFFLGLTGIGLLFKHDHTFATIWTVIFLSLIGLNSMHPNWYGGGSFSGRFELSASIVFIIPTVFALIHFLKGTSVYRFGLIIASIFLQLFYFFSYTIENVNLYNKSSQTNLNIYSIYFQPISQHLPMFYNVDWAYHYIPNYLWILFIALLVTYGFINSIKLKKTIKMLGITVLLAIVIVPILYPFKIPSLNATYTATMLPSQTGEIDNNTRIAKVNVDSRGYLNYGPYITLSSGKYQVTVTYKSSATTDIPIATFSIYSHKKMNSTYSLYGTANKIVSVTYAFQLENWFSRLFEFRTFWEGQNSMTLYSISIRAES